MGIGFGAAAGAGHRCVGNCAEWERSEGAVAD